MAVDVVAQFYDWVAGAVVDEGVGVERDDGVGFELAVECCYGGGCGGVGVDLFG